MGFFSLSLGYRHRKKHLWLSISSAAGAELQQIYIILMVNNNCENTEINNKLILLSITCVAQALYNLYLCATEIHYCTEAVCTH